VLLAQGPVVDDAGPGEFGGPGRASGVLPGATLTLAQATGSATPSRSVGAVLSPVVASAGRLVERVASVGDGGYRASLPETRPIADGADRAGQLERDGNVAEARAEMDATIKRFDQLILSAASLGGSMQARGEMLRRAWEGAAGPLQAIAKQVPGEHIPGTPVPRKPPPPVQAPVPVMRDIATLGEALAGTLGSYDDLDPDRSEVDRSIQTGFEQRAQRIRDRANVLLEYTEGQWPPTSESWRVVRNEEYFSQRMSREEFDRAFPHFTQELIHANLADLRGAMGSVGARAGFFQESGSKIVGAARDAAGVSLDAKLQAERLKSQEPGAAQPQQKDSLLDDPELSLSGEDNSRQAATGQPELTPPGSVTTPVPVDATAADSAASSLPLAADTHTDTGPGVLTSTLISDSDIDTSAAAGPGTYAGVGDPAGSGSTLT